MPNFDACKMVVELEIPGRDSCEQRLVDARALIVQLDEQVLRFMSRLYEGDRGEIRYLDARAGFEIRAIEREALVQVRVEYLDGFPDREVVVNVGIARAKDLDREVRRRAAAWWAQNLEHFDNVERVFAVSTEILDGRADSSVDRLIWDGGKEIA